MAKPAQSEEDRLAAEELEKKPAPKGHATPTRKEQEAQRKRPLVGGRTPEARAISKEQQRAQRERARVGMANGEEKYLPIRDRGPQKRFIRDYVDSRWSLGEAAIPLLVVYCVLILTNVVPLSAQEIAQYIVLGYVVLVVGFDGILRNIFIRRALAAKFGADRVEPIRFYAITRSVQLRPMRLPRPQAKRGQYPH